MRVLSVVEQEDFPETRIDVLVLVTLENLFPVHLEREGVQILFQSQ